MRALPIGLVAVAALLASLAVVRHRQESARPEPATPQQPVPAPAPVDLEEIRAAGW